MSCDPQTLRVQLDSALDLVVEIPGTVSLQRAEPEESGKALGELRIYGHVPKPPPPRSALLGMARITTSLRGQGGEEQLLAFDVVLSVEDRSPPAD
ncbi:MAG TPA: hypothetical protein PK743_06455 [Luteimonas sp.]|nr:hypothetical protein [Luteimonas sp.]HRO26543.1 hypothetical protein [Luteimonas sp.]HRP72256.1 hypothetical protein [Luteimonas sp.]